MAITDFGFKISWNDCWHETLVWRRLKLTLSGQISNDYEKFTILIKRISLIISVFLKATLVLESGKSKPAIETVISICTVFGCSYEWFLTGREYSTAGNLNNTISELVQVIKELNQSDQLELLIVAKFKQQQLHNKYNNNEPS